MASIISVTQKKVRSFLKAIYGKHYNDIVVELDDSFIVRRGSAAVNVSIKPMSKDDCIIQAMAYVVQGAKIGPRILTYLMQLNARNLIGSYGLLFDDTITFSHNIAGAHLDLNELRMTISTVAYVADETDDIIRKMAGGLRAVDANAEILGFATEAPVFPLPGKVATTKKSVASKAPMAKAPVSKKPRK